MSQVKILTAGGLAILAAALFVQPYGFDLRVQDNRAQARSGAFWKELTGASSAAESPFADLAEQLSPAVVNIKIERSGPPSARRGQPEELFEEFFGRSPRRRPRRTQSSGSGFVISADGYIVTNNHVVEDASEVTALFSDGRELEATVVGTDPKTDLALIKVEAGGDLAVAPLGDSDETRVGEWVMAIGNPFGLDHSVTVGILSAKGRSNFAGQQIAGPYDDFLQTDASINPGNSGGPLIDMQGRVVGINTAIAATGQGIGFAIPINLAKGLLPQLKESGKVTRGWLGVQIQRVSPALARSFELDEARGALVSQVFKESPAAKAKLEPGDVILEFNGRKIDDFNDLPRIVASTPPGSSVEVEVLRDGKRKKLAAQLERMEDEVVEPASYESSSTEWGFEVEPLTEEIAGQLEVDPGTKAVVVSEVEPDSPAAEAGLRRGDLILEVDRKPVSTPKALIGQLDDADDNVTLYIQRGDGTLFIALEKDD